MKTTRDIGFIAPSVVLQHTPFQVDQLLLLSTRALNRADLIPAL